MQHQPITTAAAQASTPCILHTSLNGMVTVDSRDFATLAEAAAALEAFKALHRTDRLAMAAIWNVRALKYADSWTGGIKFGPADTRHPLERMFGNAIRNGAPVVMIGEQGVSRFNGAVA